MDSCLYRRRIETCFALRPEHWRTSIGLTLSLLITFLSVHESASDTVVAATTDKERVGSFEVPIGGFLWKSSTANWKAVLLSHAIKLQDRSVPAESVLLFDADDKLRVLRQAGVGLGAQPIFFTDEGNELVAPVFQFPQTNHISRIDRIPDVEAGSPLVKLVAEVKRRIKSTKDQTLAASPSPTDRYTVSRTPWILDGLVASSGTFAMINSAGDVVEILLLDNGRIGDVGVPAGTWIKFTIRDDYSAVVSRSRNTIDYRGVTIAAASVVFWTDAIEPQSYLTAKPWVLGKYTFPAFTIVRHNWPGTSIVRPPVRMSIDDIPIDGSGSTMFEGTELVETWLAAEWIYSGKKFPAGTHVFFKSGHLKWVELSQTTNIQDLPLAGLAFFHSNGSVELGKLTSRTQIEDRDCAAASVMLFPDGRLGSCELARPQIIAGVRLRAGKFEVSARGTLIKGTLDQDLQLGSDVLHPGDVLNGIVRDKASITLVDAVGVNDLEKDITAEFDRLLPQGLLHLKDGGGGPYGSYSLDDINLQSASTSRESHSFITTRKYAIRNFLTNSPFADCDCRVELSAELMWFIDKQRHEVRAFSRLRPGQSITVETNFCPTTFAGLAFKRLFDPFGPISDQEREVAHKKFSNRLNADRKAMIELLTGKENILSYSFELNDVVLEGGEMRARCSFSRELK